MERDTGARRAKGLRRMEGIVCGAMVMCDAAAQEERELSSRSSLSRRETAEVAGQVGWYRGRDLSVKTGSKEMGREDEEVNGRNGKSLPKYCQLSYDGTCRSKLAQLCEHSGRVWLLLCPLSRATRMMMMTGLGCCFGPARRHFLDLVYMGARGLGICRATGRQDEYLWVVDCVLTKAFCVWSPLST